MRLRDREWQLWLWLLHRNMGSVFDLSGVCRGPTAGVISLSNPRADDGKLILDLLSKEIEPAAFAPNQFETMRLELLQRLGPVERDIGVDDRLHCL